MTLDHITIRTTDLPASRHFFESLFDLVERPRPSAIRHIPGHWLFAGNEPIVHLIGNPGSGYDRAANSIDHIALRIDDYADFRLRLDETGTAYSTMELPELNERRLFLHAPGGPLIEAVYREALADALAADVAAPTTVSEDVTGTRLIKSEMVGEVA